MFKIGMGYDVHRLAPNRDLIIGGVKIHYEIEGIKYGLLAHSDGDVLTHAVMDALLGAATLGDIGDHFPDTSPKYKGVSSLILLNEVRNLIQNCGNTIINIDTTIIAEAPKLSPYKNEIKKNIAATLNISVNQINVKATTEEGLGFTGNNQGIAVSSIALLGVNF